MQTVTRSYLFQSVLPEISLIQTYYWHRKIPGHPHFFVYASESRGGFVPCSLFQDLEFASRLVKQSQVPADVLLETLRLLLPTLPESELLSVTDALCPKQHPISSSAEHEHAG